MCGPERVTNSVRFSRPTDCADDKERGTVVTVVTSRVGEPGKSLALNLVLRPSTCLPRRAWQLAAVDRRKSCSLRRVHLPGLLQKPTERRPLFAAPNSSYTGGTLSLSPPGDIATPDEADSPVEVSDMYRPTLLVCSLQPSCHQLRHRFGWLRVRPAAIARWAVLLVAPALILLFDHAGARADWPSPRHQQPVVTIVPPAGTPPPPVYGFPTPSCRFGWWNTNYWSRKTIHHGFYGDYWQWGYQPGY